MQCIKIFFSSVILLRYLYLSLSAESCIGVKGFFISCAIFFAISDQAAALCTLISSVIFSIVTT